MTLVSKAPSPIQRRGKYVCPVDGCEKEFDGEQHYRMHYFRKHDDEFRRKWSRAAKRGRDEATAPTSLKATKPVSGNMLNMILSVLSKNKNPLSLDQILTGVKASGFQSSGKDANTKTYIAQVVRKNPESGVQYANGLYSLTGKDVATPVKTTKRKRQVVVEPTPAPATSLEVELALAQRQAQRSQEIAMKLFEAVMLAMQ